MRSLVEFVLVSWLGIATLRLLAHAWRHRRLWVRNIWELSSADLRRFEITTMRHAYGWPWHVVRWLWRRLRPHPRIYLVFESGHDHGEALAVYSTRERAQALADALNGPEFGDPNGRSGHNGRIARVVRAMPLDGRPVPERAWGRYHAVEVLSLPRPGTRRPMIDWIPDARDIPDHEPPAHANGDWVMAEGYGATVGEALAALEVKLAPHLPAAVTPTVTDPLPADPRSS